MTACGNKKYDYEKAMIEDIKEYIICNNWVEKNYDVSTMTYEDACNKLYEELWTEDGITGNGENYYDTEENCLQYVMPNLKLYFEAAATFDAPAIGTQDNPAQYMDCTIRCYLLQQCLRKACDEL